MRITSLVATVASGACVLALVTVPATAATPSRVALPGAVSAALPRSPGAAPADAGDDQVKVPARARVWATGLLSRNARMHAITRVPVFRARDRHGRRADRVVVYTTVLGHDGAVSSPRQIVDLDGRRHVTGSNRVSVDARTGRVVADLRLTDAQRRAVRAARREGMSERRIGRTVHLYVEHMKDVETGRGVPTWEHTGMVGGYGHLKRPAGARTRAVGADDSDGMLGGVRGDVLITNTTDTPLTLLAGPTSCMYDSLYDYDSMSSSADADSQLGTLNGKTLGVGQTVSVAVQVNHNFYSSQSKTNQFGQPVLADFAKMLGAAIHDARAAGAPDLPQWRVPGGESEDVGVEIDKELGEFVSGSVNNLLEATGLWDEFVDGLAEEGLIEAALLAESVAAVSSMFETLGPLIAIAEEFYVLFAEACSSHDGYAIIGATDPARPWRQFAQVYDMGSGHDKAIVPTIPPITDHPDSVMVSLSNGLVTGPVPYMPLPSPVAPTYYQLPALDEFATNSVINLGPGSWLWQFQFPDTQASTPATISLDPGTRRVHCTQTESADLQQQVEALGTAAVMPAWPQAAYLTWAGEKTAKPPWPTSTPASGHPTDYAIGVHYITPNAPVASVRYTAEMKDPQNWTTVAIPAGQDYVDLPSPGPGAPAAVWVGCDVQVPEIASDLTQTGRYAVLGTQIPSDVIPGPDYPATD